MTIFHGSWCILEAHCESCRREPEPCHESHSNLPLNAPRCSKLCVGTWRHGVDDFDGGLRTRRAIKDL